MELARIDKIRKNSPKRFSKKTCTQLKKDITENYKVHVEILSKHEFLSAESSSIFNELPDDVIHVKYDNVFLVKTRFNRDPGLVFKIALDFTEPPLFDFNVSPSLPTKNNSSVQVYGDDATWVEGTFGMITKQLISRKTKRAWFHKASIYDYIVWFFILPFTFWNLYKLELRVQTYLHQISPAFTVFFYLFVFVLILTLFRILFNYFKWLFPYMEFKTVPKRGYRKHRKVLSIIYFCILGALIYDLLSGIRKLLF